MDGLPDDSHRGRQPAADRQQASLELGPNSLVPAPDMAAPAFPIQGLSAGDLPTGRTQRAGPKPARAIDYVADWK
jgi:hypothetical protein